LGIIQKIILSALSLKEAADFYVPNSAHNDIIILDTQYFNGGKYETLLAQRSLRAQSFT